MRNYYLILKNKLKQRRPILIEWKEKSNPKNLKDGMGYDCPSCGWEKPCNEDSEHYIIKGSKCFIIENYWIMDEKDYSKSENKLITSQIKQTIYPIISNYSVFPYGYYGTEYSWGETHYCPFCQKEFKFSNGT